MKLPTHHYSDQVSMADSASNTRGHNPNLRKMLNPGVKKKFAMRTFGVPLVELVSLAPQGYKVPYLVKKICSYIEHNGLDHEGIFRVNGSQRIVEKLKLSFDEHGNANLEEDNDVMAVAGLLKLFLRELPESTIPERMTKRFVNIQEEHQRNAKESIPKLKVLLKELPEEHYDLLKHVIRFLAIVACNESVNKMSPMALAIVFGPNIFRCGKGFLALKDQGSTNQIVYRFIVDYNTLFKDPTEDPPALYWERKKHNIVPPRPPPPKFVFEEPSETTEMIPVKPTPLPRKSKLRTTEGNHISEIEEPDHSESSISSRGRNSHSYNSPSFSDDEMTGRCSPFHLDSDSGFSLVESPVPSARTSEFVDKAIKQTVIGHLFGDDTSLLNASIDTTIRESHSDTSGLDGNEIQVNNQDELGDSTPTNSGIKDRMKMFESSQSQDITPTNQPNKQIASSKAFQMFENKGILITQMSDIRKMDIAGNDVDNDDELTPDGEEFEIIQQNTDQLHNFKRPAGPQNRRSPSRRIRNSSNEPEEDNMEEIENVEIISNGVMNHNGVLDVSKSKERKVDCDVNHNDAKARIAFLDIRPENGHPSNDKSPSLSAKPFVPPLDFSTLHENIGGQAPIPAQKAQTASYLRATNIASHTNTNNEDNDDDGADDDEENEIPSPHSNKVKRKAGTTVEDEELPPFSQVDQDQYKLHSHGSTDDEITSKMKSQMRKIQGLKKKIRQYEDAFESEHGFKPSHTEKAARPEIKKFMMELSRARKEAKKLKEEAEMGSRSRHGSGASSTGERVEPPDLPTASPTMSQTLDVILKKLKEKRKESRRPEDIELMVHEQVQDEKLAVQKSLLHFESIHGRPKTKDEKDLMRPLYDRYRTIKRLLSHQPMSPRGNLELQTVPEDKPIDINSRHGDQNFVEPLKSTVMSVRVPTGIMENDEEEDPVPALGTMDFAVTRDFSILKTRPVAVDDQGPHSPKARRKLERENIENRNTTDSNLHELSVSELQDELLRSRNSKKKLRKALRDFEENFSKRTGKKVGREDRMPMQTEYNEYKQLKARLKLLEALLSKHHHAGF